MITLATFLTTAAVIAGCSYEVAGVGVDLARQDQRDSFVRLPATPENTVRLGVYRLTGIGGDAAVSSGIPLPPGLLFPDQIDSVRILVNGQEPAAHIEALTGLHNDGSLRAILAQFTIPVGGIPLNAELRIGEPRQQPDPGKTAVQLTLDAPYPQAVILPTEPDYLISTGIVGPTIGVAEADRFDPLWQRRFHQYGDAKWQVQESDYLTVEPNHAIDRNFYDRSLAEFAYWARSADVEHFRRGLLYALVYREKYHRKYNYKVQPHNSMIEGEALLYHLLGDEEGRHGAELNAAYFREVWLPPLSDPIGKYTANRPMARTIEAFLTARRVGAGGGDWEGSLRQALDAFLAHQSADGAFRYAAQCNASNNFQTGLFNDAMIRYFEEFEPDPRIVESIQRNTDWMWATQWVPAGGGFKYSEAVCTKPNAGATENAAPDLNLLIVNAFGFLYQQLGDPTYLLHGDEVFHVGIRRAWMGGNALQGNKQFNQQYRSAYRYLLYRRGPGT
ncbi:MAG: hypothetical protein ACREL7_18935 [Longimicrobiales bacterium]